MAGVESVQAEFESIVGGGAVVSDDVTCRALAVDGLVPKSVVYPQTAEQVAAVLKCAAEHKLAVIPCRNATKLGIGNTPAQYDIALSLKKMNNVWHYEPEDLTATVEAGMKLGDLKSLLARNGLWMPLDPPGGASASVGGVLATNAAGPLRLLYGSPRDMIVGMKIATTDGKIIKAGGRVVKNVAGYDLTKLLIGSHGSLGVIVEANLKLFPAPLGRTTFVFRVPSIMAARDLRQRIVNSPLTPMRMILLNSEAGARLVEAEPNAPARDEMTMWFEAGGTKCVLDRYARTLGEISKAGGMPVSSLTSAESEQTWSRIADSGAFLRENSPRLISLRVSLPIAAGEEFVDRAHQEADRARLLMAVVAQTAAGVVNLHILDASDAVALIENLRAAAKELRGSLVVEHCAPEIKKRVDVWGATGNDFEIMRKIKQAWDPKGILSPGRFVGSL
jgi:glycolate dehydrogenase FAD-binding subunit